MASSVHPVQIVELLVTPRHCGYVRAIDFDKLPDTGGVEPVAECRANIETIERSRPVVATLAEDERLAQATILLAPAAIGLLRNPRLLAHLLDARPSPIRKSRRGRAQDP